MRDPKVDAFLSRTKEWKEEFIKLRAIILDCGLTEEFKWGWPCYSVNGGNVVLMHGFKEYCALLFMKGALMKDPKKILIRQSENVQAARQIRFTSAREITAPVIKAYIKEAVRVEKAGLEVELKKTSEYPVPEELKAKFREMPELSKAFYALTPGRQRGYLLYFSAAKQSATREARIGKYVKKIMDGKGLND